MLAYQLKLKAPIDELITTSPDLPIHNVIMKLLVHVRPDTPAATVIKVVEYIAKEWEARRLKMAA